MTICNISTYTPIIFTTQEDTTTRSINDASICKVTTVTVTNRAPKRIHNMSKFHKDGVIEDESATLMFDDMFAMIASKTNGIEHLLDLFFNFLKRKTDFYIDYDNTNIKDTICSNEMSIKYKMGFPKGIAEKLLLKSFRKYPYVDYFTAMKQSQHSDDNQSINNSNNNATTYYRQSIQSNNDTNATTSSSSIPPTSSSSSSISTAAPIPSSISFIKYTSDGKQIPIGNGGIGLNGSYYWTQTLNDVSIYIDNTIISTSISSGSSSDQKHSEQQKIKGKDVKCIIKPLSLLLEIYGHTLIQG